MIRFDSISKQHGRQILFFEASAAVHRGEKIGLVGPNGSGKTTLFRTITREEHPDGGQVTVDRGVSVGYFSQDVGEMSGRPVIAEVLDGYALDARAREILAGLGFDPEVVDGDVGKLSGGWKMRVALARILLMRLQQGIGAQKNESENTIWS